MDGINIDKTLLKIKPTDGDRMDKEIETYDLLEKLDIPYIGVDHCAVATIEDCYIPESALGIELCKNLFLCNGSKTDFYLLVLPGHKKFVTKDVSKQIGTSRLSFGDAGIWRNI
jgi:Ala-tRNA(Pro) deacylase